MTVYVSTIHHGRLEWTRHVTQCVVDGERTLCGRFPERIGLGEVIEGEPPPSGWVRECRTCARLGAAAA